MTAGDWRGIVSIRCLGDSWRDIVSLRCLSDSWRGIVSSRCLGDSWRGIVSGHMCSFVTLPVWLSGNTFGLDQYSYSTLGPVTAWNG